MPYLRSRRPTPSHTSKFFSDAKKKLRIVAANLPLIVLVLSCLAQDRPQTSEDNDAQPSQQAGTQTTVTIPAGTRLALVLTHPIQSRYIHRGDDIYAQTTAPVDSGNEVIIPAGTFVQGTVDKLGKKGDRGELVLQSMLITFPDGYVIPITGPMTLESDEGYALKDPGKGRSAGAFALPAEGAGLGALIGHFAANAHSTTITQTLPPNCGVPTPGCTNGTSQSLTIPGNTLKNTAIGTGVGATVGMVASIALLVSSHHFYLDAGAPLDMTLQRPVSLPQDEVASAVRQSGQYPVAVPAVAPRPFPPPLPVTSVDHGTCYTPGTPGTPPTVIPGPPGPDGVPGPPTVIPGTPPTPGTPYPCP